MWLLRHAEPLSRPETLHRRPVLRIRNLSSFRSALPRGDPCHDRGSYGKIGPLHESLTPNPLVVVSLRLRLWAFGYRVQHPLTFVGPLMLSDPSRAVRLSWPWLCATMLFFLARNVRTTMQCSSGPRTSSTGPPQPYCALSNAHDRPEWSENPEYLRDTGAYSVQCRERSAPESNLARPKYARHCQEPTVTGSSVGGSLANSAMGAKSKIGASVDVPPSRRGTSLP